jgi:7-keto-8-aminopelargonate synthetase-like enzyme
MKRGVNVQPILYPAVADNASRLRFFLSSLHSEAQLTWTATVVAEELAKIRAENA